MQSAAAEIFGGGAIGEEDFGGGVFAAGVFGVEVFGAEGDFAFGLTNDKGFAFKAEGAVHEGGIAGCWSSTSRRKTANSTSYRVLSSGEGSCDQNVPMLRSLNIVPKLTTITRPLPVLLVGNSGDGPLAVKYGEARAADDLPGVIDLDSRPRLLDDQLARH